MAVQLHNHLQKQNHPSLSRKSFPEKKGTKTTGRQKNWQLASFLSSCPTTVMVWWWWLNVLKRSSSLVYLTQINSLHLHGREGEAVVGSGENLQGKGFYRQSLGQLGRRKAPCTWMEFDHTHISPKSPGLTTSPTTDMRMKDVHQGIKQIFPLTPSFWGRKTLLL